MPDRAGVEVGILEWIKFMITTIPHAPNFWASRPAVVEGRLSKVHSLTGSMVMTLGSLYCKFILEEVRKNWGGGVCTCALFTGMLFTFWAGIASEVPHAFVWVRQFSPQCCDLPSWKVPHLSSQGYEGTFYF